MTGMVVCASAAYDLSMHCIDLVNMPGAGSCFQAPAVVQAHSCSCLVSTAMQRLVWVLSTAMAGQTEWVCQFATFKVSSIGEGASQRITVATKVACTASCGTRDTVD